MLKKSVLPLTLMLLLVFVGSFAQSDQQAAQRAALQKLLLTQDETNAVLGTTGWTEKTTGKLEPEPTNAITAAVVYEKPGDQRGQIFQFTDALFEFADVQSASSYFSNQLIKDNFKSPVLPPADDAKLAQIKQALNVAAADKKGADDATYATLQETGESVIAFVKDNHISFIRGNLDLINELLQLAKKQLDILVNGRPQK